MNNLFDQQVLWLLPWSSRLSGLRFLTRKLGAVTLPIRGLSACEESWCMKAPEPCMLSLSTCCEQKSRSPTRVPPGSLLLIPFNK
ncbi:hypothetical protein H920_14811 [Fukomys damarensis]|uniref:Uncharacterized protein n=1 Tax=Fukomys damarensis TaxID=885580 RepID=A0A091CXZ0_FUKDA|nr:hypothetical protein H920_14811 [Fukomys damarensis]